MRVHAGHILTQLFDMGSFHDDLPLQVFNEFLLLCNSFLKTTFFVPQLQYLFFALVVNRQNFTLKLFNVLVLLGKSLLQSTIFVPQLEYLFFALLVNRQNLHLYSVDIHTQLLTQALVQLLYAVVAYCK